MMKDMKTILQLLRECKSKSLMMTGKHSLEENLSKTIEKDEKELL